MPDWAIERLRTYEILRRIRDDSDLKGTRKASMLKSIFGEDFGKAFNQYVDKRLKQEFGKGEDDKGGPS